MKAKRVTIISVASMVAVVAGAITYPETALYMIKWLILTVVFASGYIGAAVLVSFVAEKLWGRIYGETRRREYTLSERSAMYRRDRSA